MGKNRTEVELDDKNKGRLDEREIDELGLTNSGRRQARAACLVITRVLVIRKTARLAKAPALSARLGVTLGSNAHIAVVAPYHFRSSFVSRPREPESVPASSKSGRKIMLFPSTARQFALVKKVGVYDKSNRVWTVSADHPFARSRRGREMQSEFARVKRAVRLAGHSAAASKISANDFQKYIERDDLSDCERAAALDSDDQGYISIGTIGSTAAERQSFWKAVDLRENQHGARLQSRIEFELPYWLPPSRRRQILEKFSKFLSSHGLPHWLAAHRPGPESDKRAFHGHCVWHDRAVISKSDRFSDNRSDGMDIVRAAPIFAEKKDRNHQGENWIRTLRREFAEIVNDVLLEEAVSKNQLPPFFFFPGSYQELGITATPQKHRGARNTAILRRRSIDTQSDRNDLAVEADLMARVDRAIRQIQSNIELISRKQKDMQTRTGPAQDEEEPDEAMEDLVLRTEQSISGLAFIDSYFFDPVKPCETGSLGEKLRAFGYVPIELNSLEEYARSRMLLSEAVQNVEKTNLIKDGIQAALARLYFLHCLELTAATSGWKVLNLTSAYGRHKTFLTKTESSVSSMRPPQLQSSLLNDIPTGDDEQKINPEMVTWINVRPLWDAVATHYGAQSSRTYGRWYIPTNVSAASRSILLKFFGTVESKISLEVSRKNHAEIIARGKPGREITRTYLETRREQPLLETDAKATASNSAQQPPEQPLSLAPTAKGMNPALYPPRSSRSMDAQHNGVVPPEVKSTLGSESPKESVVTSAALHESYSYSQNHAETNRPKRYQLGQTRTGKSLAAAASELYQNARKLEESRRTASRLTTGAKFESSLRLNYEISEYIYRMDFNDPDSRLKLEQKATRLANHELLAALICTQAFEHKASDANINSQPGARHEDMRMFWVGLQILDNEIHARRLTPGSLREKYSRIVGELLASSSKRSSTVRAPVAEPVTPTIKKQVDIEPVKKYRADLSH